MDPLDQVFFLEPGQAPSFDLKGIRIDQLLPREACRRFSAYLVRMQPGQIKKPSFHKEGEELYYVLSGSGTARLGGREYVLKKGCFFRVPPNIVHQFAAGEEPLHLLNFHSPPVFSDHDSYFPEQDRET
ncbi:MAG: cupin domain-containing protein [Nitrospinaceae bacterium]